MTNRSRTLREIKEMLSRDAARIAEIKASYLDGSLKADDYLRLRVGEECRFLEVVEGLLKKRLKGNT